MYSPLHKFSPPYTQGIQVSQDPDTQPTPTLSPTDLPLTPSPMATIRLNPLCQGTVGYVL